MARQKELITQLKERSFQLALKIIYVHKDVVINYTESILSKKLLENGTILGEYLLDASSTKTRVDFNYYLLKSQQTLERTKYWLGLLHESSFINSDSYDALINEIKDISRLITKYEQEKYQAS